MRRKSEEWRNLQEALATARGLRAYELRRAWEVHRIKLLLRAAGGSIPRPRCDSGSELTRRAIEASRRGETVEVDIEDL